MCTAGCSLWLFLTVYSSDILNTLLFGVADYVFFENSSSNPYLIRRIEELNKVLNCFSFFAPEGEWPGIFPATHNHSPHVYVLAGILSANCLTAIDGCSFVC